MKYALLIGRILFALIFLMSGPGHFSAATIGFAASKGVPMASVLVPLSGVIEIIGGLSILLGYKTKWGALLLIVFLIPVTFTLHAFWNVADPMMKQMDMAAFMKNISMLGAALMISYFGAGPVSIDNKQLVKA
ncbi:DoxX family protein [Taibaiella soli]|uniref:DoxX family protein n=1 Tax=Taibaiella soli TaxID=1649169 RepID=A0A2W2AHD3_9BACT|nr:DoxX family protein [Taibaiella soli]PZF74905.1 DoxX family protein [Taibaiella soli]